MEFPMFLKYHPALGILHQLSMNLAYEIEVLFYLAISPTVQAPFSLMSMLMVNLNFEKYMSEAIFYKPISKGAISMGPKTLFYKSSCHRGMT